jgi:hypothetical protein
MPGLARGRSSPLHFLEAFDDIDPTFDPTLALRALDEPALSYVPKANAAALWPAKVRPAAPAKAGRAGPTAVPAVALPTHKAGGSLGVRLVIAGPIKAGDVGVSEACPLPAALTARTSSSNSLSSSSSTSSPSSPMSTAESSPCHSPAHPGIYPDPLDSAAAAAYHAATAGPFALGGFGGLGARVDGLTKGFDALTAGPAAFPPAASGHPGGLLGFDLRAALENDSASGGGYGGSFGGASAPTSIGDDNIFGDARGIDVSGPEPLDLDSGAVAMALDN